ncbi:DUF2203 domain-containing protein [Paenibacillus contaminans]|uniref:DUF2203 domain-containing protein n=1 Tax=Paenibacillus contaminans TaxID=450362 RepID=A0A329LYU0_9BACL|nr:DUF2203 domain-containing protein [Paenibacillus contaminans]RAV12999.1 DUF2203 domain-containing protein [Paenibacillus contaminans]
MKKHFTVQEANALLPVIRTELEALQDTVRNMEDKVAELRLRKFVSSAGDADLGNDPFFELECEIEFLQIEAHTQIKGIHMKGAQLKDIENGLVDFPAVLDGQDVLLCWRQGEERIMFYHGMEEGFRGRKPLG